MNAVALIVDADTPDLTGLALASLTRFAPDVRPVVFAANGSRHAEALHAVRAGSAFVGGQILAPDRYPYPDVVILLDSDAMVCSPRWWPAIRERLEAGATVVGGFRSRGDASQMFIDGVPVMHASMLAMTRDVWLTTSSFEQAHDSVTNYMQFDTAARVSLEAFQRGEPVATFPFFRVGHGPRFPGIQVGEYFEPGAASTRETLWAHCWRGTSMRRASWRNRLGAWCGSPHSRTWLAAQERKRRYLELGKLIVGQA